MATPDRQRLTFAQAARRWIKSKVRLRASTRCDYLIMLECYLEPYFGARKLETISRMDIEGFRSEMTEGVPDLVKRARDARLLELKAANPQARLKPLDPGPRTTNKCLGVLVSVFGYARKHNLVVQNVAERIEKLPTEELGESRVIVENVLTPAELVRVIDAAVDPYRIPIALAAYCGLREAEVLGLKWPDIDWIRGTAQIRRTQRAGVFSIPKSKASRRTVELPPDLLAELQQWRLRCPPSKEDLVCPSITGLPMQASALLQRGFHPALAQAGIRRVRYHDLRHSFASNLLEAGVDIVTVSKAHGPCERLHHLGDVRACAAEGAARGERSHGGAHGPRWKQYGNIRGKEPCASPLRDGASN